MPQRRRRRRRSAQTASSRALPSVGGRAVLNPREQKRDRLLEVLGWEQAMERERSKITSSFYWTVLEDPERQRLLQIFDAEREQTNNLVVKLLAEYKPNMAPTRIRDQLRQREARRVAERVRGNHRPQVAGANLSEFQLGRREFNAPPEFYRFDEEQPRDKPQRTTGKQRRKKGRRKQGRRQRGQPNLPDASVDGGAFGFYIGATRDARSKGNEMERMVVPTGSAAGLEIIQQRTPFGLLHLPSLGAAPTTGTHLSSQGGVGNEPSVFGHLDQRARSLNASSSRPSTSGILHFGNSSGRAQTPLLRSPIGSGGSSLAASGSSRGEGSDGAMMALPSPTHSSHLRGSRGGVFSRSSSRPTTRGSDGVAVASRVAQRSRGIGGVSDPLGLGPTSHDERKAAINKGDGATASNAASSYGELLREFGSPIDRRMAGESLAAP